MKTPGNHLIPLLFFLSIMGCNDPPGRIVSGSPPTKQEAILLDSLQSLDSLLQAYKSENTSGSQEYVKSKGKVMYSLSLLNRSSVNVGNSITYLDSALRISRSVNDFATLSNSLNLVGSIYYSIGEKEIARVMFDSAYSVAKAHSLFPQMGSSLGNLARFEPDPEKSIKLSKLALSWLEKSGGSGEPVAMILINIGYRSQDTDSSLYYYNMAVSMTDADSSSDVVIAAYNNMAYCYLEKRLGDDALRCIEKYALPGALRTNNLEWQWVVYDTYADVLDARGRLTEAKAMREKSVTLEKAYKESVSSGLRSIRNF